MNTESPLPVAPPEVEKWQRVALAAGGIGVAVCVLLALAGYPTDFFRAWLVAFCLCTGLAVGPLVIVMLQYLTGGNWGFVLRRPLEAATRTLPLMALLFLPLTLGLPELYSWARPDQVADDEMLQHKAPYLNSGFWIVRGLVILGIWNLLMFLLNRWSRLQDQTKDPEITNRCAALSAPGLILYVVTVTFASIDWVMSLEPHWYSTIYGAMFGMGQVLSGFALCVAVFLLVTPPDSMGGQQNLRDLGSLLLAFVMVWAYLSLMQFLLIWAGNLPEEVPWYIARLEGGWSFAALAMVLFHFALPFVLLLSTDIKRNRRTLAGVALLVLGMRIVDNMWLIVPAYQHDRGIEVTTPPIISILMYAAALAGVGGLWLGVFLWQLRQWPLLPAIQPANGEVAHHG